MENFELLMEKYKNEMMQLAKRAVNQVNEENTEYVTRTEERNDVSDDVQVRETEVETASTVYPTGRGKLKIKVFTGNEAFPVMSALVQVLDGEALLFQEFTDQSGTVSELYLPAPSRTISESPGNEKGYATYRIIVSHPRFNTVILEEVPVFEGIESVQPVALEPINNIGSVTVRENESMVLEEGNNA